MIKEFVRGCKALLTFAWLLSGIATCAMAQSKAVQFPAGLKWEWMHYASFNFQPDEGQIDPKIKSVAYALWKSKLDAVSANADKTKSKPIPVFVLLSSPYTKNQIFSMVLSTAENCLFPGNGPGMVDMYALCPMSVFQVNATPVRTKEVPNMCFLHLNNSDNPASRFHTEFAFNEANRTAYFRVIQAGKEVPACNRMVNF